MSLLSLSPHRGVMKLAPALRLVVVVMLLALGACASRAPAPIEERAPRPAPPPPIAAPAPKPAPEPDWRPPAYTVKRGDTLYAIALDHGLDYRELAAWNNIENPNRISVGQVLRLAAPGEGAPASASGVTTMPLKTVPPIGMAEGKAPMAPGAGPPRNTENYKAQPKALKEPYSEQAVREVARLATAPYVAAPAAPQAPSPPGGAQLPLGAAGTSAPPAGAPPAGAPPAAGAVASTAAGAAPSATAAPAARSEPRPAAAPGDEDDERLEWVWPAKGKLVTGFTDNANLKGIDIAGTAGAPVVASAPGKVVYAGTGLRGYGKLVIVKHNGTYLSAYAHNRDVLVKEGQSVARGQKIAEMGNTDADQVKLHFEIRRHGKPVDPMKFLPPA
jgi:lipoprotein NlpD